MRNFIGDLCIVIGIVLIIAALSLFGYNLNENNQAYELSNDILKEMIEITESSNDAQPDTQTETQTNTTFDEPVDTTMKVVDIDGYGYIGYITIPKLKLELPVMDEWDYTRLKIAPCRYHGTVKSNDLVIAAHNYRVHFSRIRELQEGDKVIFTDMDGVSTFYSVVQLDVLSSVAIEEMTAGEYALTLFTCTYGGQSRLALRCDMN